MHDCVIISCMFPCMYVIWCICSSHYLDRTTDGGLLFFSPVTHSNTFNPRAGHIVIVSFFRTLPVMIPRWNLTWTPRTGLWWRDICSSDLQMLLKHGTGKKIGISSLISFKSPLYIKKKKISTFLFRRWFSIQNSQLVYQKRLKVTTLAD